VRVVCVHGIGVTSAYFAPLVRELERRHEVAAPDLPGWGSGPKPRHVLDLQELAASLVPLLPAAIVANSLGCQVAVELAIAHPELVPSLVLIGPTVDPHTSLPVGFVRDSAYEPPSLWWLIARDYARMGVRRFVRTAQLALRQPLAERLPLVQAPALVLRGAHDGIVSRRWCAEVAALLPRGRFVQLARGAHAVHYTDPALVAEEIEQHLAER